MREETLNFYAEPIGASWVVRDKKNGEVLCFRPDKESAVKAMEAIENSGLLA